MGNTIRSDGVVPRVQRDFKRWDQYVVPLFNRKTGELTRPERYTRTNEEGKDRIQDLRENYTKTSWMTNFLLRPYDGENMVERGWIKFVDKRPKRFDWVCVGDDPAISMNNHTDRHALVVVGKKGDDYYVLDCAILKGKEKSQKNTTQTTYNLYKKWKANVINFESV